MPRRRSPRQQFRGSSRLLPALITLWAMLATAYLVHLANIGKIP